MSVGMPEPAPLDMPSGDPAAVDDLVRDVAGAAYRLAGLAGQLAGSAAAAPGWLGADAVAAETELARVAEITRGSAEAVLTAAGRLSTHGGLLRDTRREVTALRAEQDEDFRIAWQRLGEIEDPRLAVMTGSSAWVGVVAELEAAESRRRRRHALVLEELADDASATVRELADACRSVAVPGGQATGGVSWRTWARRCPGGGTSSYGAGASRWLACSTETSKPRTGTSARERLRRSPGPPRSRRDSSSDWVRTACGTSSSCWGRGPSATMQGPAPAGWHD